MPVFLPQAELMRIRRVYCRLTQYSLLLLAAGCALGGQSSDDTLGCPKALITPLSGDDDTSELGFSASQLSWAWRSESQSGLWHEVQGVTLNADPSETVVQVELGRAEGATIVRDEGWCGSKALVVPAALRVTTSDGLVNEHLPVELLATRPDFATVVAPVSFAALQGSLTVTPVSEGRELVQPTFQLTLTPNGLSGALAATLQQRSRQGLSALPGGRLLHWPSDSECGAGLVPAPLDATESPWSNLDWTRRPWQATLTSPVQGESSELSIEVASSLCESESDGVKLPAQMVIASSRVASLAAEGAFVARDGALSFLLDSSAASSRAANDFITHFSDLGLAADAYEAFALDLNLTLSDDLATGTLHVHGYVDECRHTCGAPGCGGCGPLSKELLLTLRLGPK